MTGSNNATVRAVVVVADGVEEMEAVITVDVLRRAGWAVSVAGLSSAPVTASRGVRLVPDLAWNDVGWADVDVLILPGGLGGVERLLADPRVPAMCRDRLAEQRWVAAICAAPLVLKEAGVLAGRRITSHPSVAEALRREAEYVEDDVVVHDRLITSRGPGTAFAFALELVRRLDDPAKPEALAAAMVLQNPG